MKYFAYKIKDARNGLKNRIARGFNRIEQTITLRNHRVGGDHEGLFAPPNRAAHPATQSRNCGVRNRVARG